eukprot:g4487.t1
MTWRGQQNWNQKAQDWKNAWPVDKKNQDKQKKAKENQNAKEKEKTERPTFFLSHDGRKVPLGSGGGAFSAASASTSARAVQEENRRLKEALKLISEKRTVDNGVLEDCQKLIQNPREQLRERQRELNKEKKTLTRQEKLEATIKETDDSYKSWRAGMEEGLKQEDARHVAEIEKLQHELKELQEGKDPDAMKEDMDDEKLLREGSMAQELYEVRESMKEMAYHVETLEQRNQEMVMQMNSQVQALVTAIKGSKPIELFNEGSPQLIKKPQVYMSPRTNSHDRSRSPVKRSAEAAELKDIGEIHTMVRPLLKKIPDEHHHKIMAILEAEGDKYQTLEAAEILIQQSRSVVSGQESEDEADESDDDLLFI